MRARDIGPNRGLVLGAPQKVVMRLVYAIFTFGCSEGEIFRRPAHTLFSQLAALGEVEHFDGMPNRQWISELAQMLVDLHHAADIAGGDQVG